MKRRILPLAFIAALVLAFGAVTAACGGGGGEPLTLQEYFQRLDEVFENADERFLTLADQCEEIAESEGAEIAATRCFFNATTQVLREIIDEAEALDPPTEAEAVHDELVTAGADFRQLLEGLGERLADIESTSELEELSEDRELEAAGERFERTCFDLEEIARQNDIDVDLGCEG